jgi:hypothetical protein
VRPSSGRHVRAATAQPVEWAGWNGRVELPAKVGGFFGRERLGSAQPRTAVQTTRLTRTVSPARFTMPADALTPGVNLGAMMANYPHDRHYPQAAGPTEPPASMVNAVRLMYAGAGVAVVFGLTAVLTMHSSRTVHLGNPASGAYKAGQIAGGVIGGLIIGGLWLWMAWANKRGRSWARIVSTVFFGLLTPYAAGSLASTLPTALKIVVIIEWAAGLAAIVFLWQRQSSQYYKAVSQPTGHAPVPNGQLGLWGSITGSGLGSQPGWDHR